MGRISYSQISMYSDCPLRWKLNYVDRLSISESNGYCGEWFNWRGADHRLQHDHRLQKRVNSFDQGQ